MGPASLLPSFDAFFSIKEIIQHTDPCLKSFSLTPQPLHYKYIGRIIGITAISHVSFAIVEQSQAGISLKS